MKAGTCYLAKSTLANADRVSSRRTQHWCDWDLNYIVMVVVVELPQAPEDDPQKR